MLDTENGITRSKVMATLTYDQLMLQDFLEDMIEGGLDGVRLNSAHLTPDRLKECIEIIREVDKDITVLVDTKGAEARTYDNRKGLTIHFSQGEEVTVHTTRKATDSTHKDIYINADAFPDGINNMILRLGDDLEFLITEVIDPQTARAEAVTNGKLAPRQTATLGLYTFKGLEAVTDRDRRSIQAAIEAGADIIAHSFVRNADDVNAVRAIIGDTPIQLWAKIETGDGFQNCPEIAAASDGILIARGDLANAVSLLMLPAMALKICADCEEAGKPFMVCTHVLHSMMDNPQPTRAEAEDVFNYMLRGAEWQMLTNETAAGKYPVVAVRTLSAIIDCCYAMATDEGLPDDMLQDHPEDPTEDPAEDPAD